MCKDNLQELWDECAAGAERSRSRRRKRKHDSSKKLRRKDSKKDRKCHEGDRAVNTQRKPHKRRQGGGNSESTDSCGIFAHPRASSSGTNAATSAAARPEPEPVAPPAEVTDGLPLPSRVPVPSVPPVPVFDLDPMCDIPHAPAISTMLPIPHAPRVPATTPLANPQDVHVPELPPEPHIGSSLRGTPEVRPTVPVMSNLMGFRGMRIPYTPGYTPKSSFLENDKGGKGKGQASTASKGGDKGDVNFFGKGKGGHFRPAGPPGPPPATPTTFSSWRPTGPSGASSGPSCSEWTVGDLRAFEASAPPGNWDYDQDYDPRYDVAWGQTMDAMHDHVADSHIRCYYKGKHKGRLMGPYDDILRDLKILLICSSIT